MKLTKSGEIEACCDLVDKKRPNYQVSKDSDGTEHIDIEVGSAECTMTIPLKKFKMCPNCGAKTEIEGEEKHE